MVQKIHPQGVILGVFLSPLIIFFSKKNQPSVLSIYKVVLVLIQGRRNLPKAGVPPPRSILTKAEWAIAHRAQPSSTTLLNSLPKRRFVKGITSFVCCVWKTFDPRPVIRSVDRFAEIFL